MRRPLLALALALLCAAGPHAAAASLARVLGAAPAAPPAVPTPGATSVRPSVLREPAGLQGVPAPLAALAGACFSLDATPTHRYIYEFCPFRNVSQREHPATYNSFFGLLGTWEGWEPQQRGLVGLYTDGTECGLAKQRRLARVQWLCSTGGAYVLKGVLEPRQCEYRLTFASPEACGLALPIASASPEAAPVAAPAPAPAAEAPAPAPAPSAAASSPSKGPATAPAAAEAEAAAAPPGAPEALPAAGAGAGAGAGASAAATTVAAPAAAAAALDPGAALLAVLQELKDTRAELGGLKADLMRSTRELLKEQKRAAKEGMDGMEMRLAALEADKPRAPRGNAAARGA